MKTKMVIHEFLSEDNTRQGIVFRYKDDPAWYVDCYEHGHLSQTRKMETDGVLHSEQYAEDCAENWVFKIF
jgi:hypothetical protein